MPHSLRHSVYVGVLAIVLALSGIFVSFASREVISRGITLSTTVLLVMLGSGALLAGLSARRSNASLVQVWVSAFLGALVVAAMLLALAVVESSIDLRFVFANLTQPVSRTLTFGQEMPSGLITLLLVAVGVGAVVAALLTTPSNWRRVVLLALGMTVVIGLLEGQIAAIITLPDALAVAGVFALGYLAGTLFKRQGWLVRLLISAVPGIVTGVILASLANGGALDAGGILRGVGSSPLILGVARGNALLPLVLIFGIVSIIGATAVSASASFHNSILFFIVTLVVIGVLNAQNAMSVTAALITLAIYIVAFALVPALGKRVESRFSELKPSQRRGVQGVSFAAMLLLLLVAPAFLGQYITDVLNLVGLYIIMGIGLNIVVGYAGLLDLGYVAFFAIGAYSIGLLTTPSLLTCGGIPPDAITSETVGSLCTGVMTFWEAWPIATLIAACAGILLGIPILRLRGDYLAIVTLGFGEIIRLLVRFDDFKDLFGSAQGIANIPRPVIDLTSLNPAWRFELTGSNGIYYLVLVGILITALIASRLAVTRLGRSWLAMRADEDVAQAMGINLVRTKLLAFAIGAAFAGMGGAVAGTRLYGAYPDSYTVLVSINVLSLIIIGGLGSIPGVVVGALVLVGLPEALRELSDYRLLAFGALLVAAMLIKPQGLIPPQARRLSELLQEQRERRRVS
jgi:branched-chain amino acid transport system permease protein